MNRGSVLTIALTRTVAALLLAATVLLTHSPAEAAPDVEPEAIEEIVTDYLAESGAPGAAVAVTRGTEIVYAGGVGTAGDGRPMTGTTRLRIASLSKSFTALAVMQLVDQGSVDLDDPVVTYLPEFSLDDHRTGDITVRHLLNHSSGMADASSPDEYASGPATPAEAVRRLRSASLVADPGTEWNYHNPNYHVAARLVEVVSAESFDHYLDEHVFGPAGMGSTTSTATTNAAVPGLAGGHTFAFGEPIAVDGPDYFSMGAGGVVSTAEDLARWLILHNNAGATADGRPVVSPDSVDEMHRAQEPNAGTYALGWYHTPADADRSEHISHSGGAAAFSGYQVLYPVDGPDYGIAVLLNGGASLTGPTPTDPAQNIAARLGLDQPAQPDPSRAVIVDLAFGLAGILVLGVGWLGVRHARAWATARRHRPWRAVIRLTPYLLLIGCVAAVPRLQLLLVQRDAPWAVLFYVAPVVVTTLGLAAASSAAVITLRTIHLVRHDGATQDTTK